MRVAIYARVSTVDRQDIDMQLRSLREYCTSRQWEITGEYTDVGFSGAKDRRPALDRLMDDARKRKIDLILVWQLDRFGRSLKHLVNSMDELNSLKVAFVSYRENLDLSTATGRLMFHVISAMAEFERSLICERVKEGIKNARDKGKRWGRDPLAPITRRRIIEVHEAEPGLSIRKLAKKVKQTPATVYKTVSFFRSGKLNREGFEVSQN